MKPELSRRIIGGVAAVWGLWWTCWCIAPTSRLWREDITAVDFILELTMGLAFGAYMAIPGILALFHGLRLVRGMNESSLKCVVGVGALLLALMLSTRLSLLFPTLLPMRVLGLTLLFACSFAVIPLYFVVVRFLLRHLTHGAPPSAPLGGRIVVFLISLQLWLLLSAYFREYSPTQEGRAHVPKEPWGWLGAFVPMLVAYGTYRIASGLLDRKRNKPAPPTAGHVPF